MDDVPLEKKKRKRKLIGNSDKTIEVDMPNVNPPPSPKTPETKRQPKRPMVKHSAKQANLVACNATAKNLFAQSDKIKMLEEEIGRLRQQLQEKEEV